MEKVQGHKAMLNWLNSLTPKSHFLNGKILLKALSTKYSFLKIKQNKIKVVIGPKQKEK